MINGYKVTNCVNCFLILFKGAEYEVLDDSQEHWWKVRDSHGSVGYIPSNYVKEKELLGLQKYELVGLILLVFSDYYYYSFSSVGRDQDLCIHSFPGFKCSKKIHTSWVLRHSAV